MLYKSKAHGDSFRAAYDECIIELVPDDDQGWLQA
jgi:hypothetical protein